MSSGTSISACVNSLPVLRLSDEGDRCIGREVVDKVWDDDVDVLR